MTRTKKLLALAEAVYAKNKDDWELKQALVKFDKEANPETIKQLVELIRLQHEALQRVKNVKFHQIEEAIEAFEKFERGEK